MIPKAKETTIEILNACLLLNVILTKIERPFQNDTTNLLLKIHPSNHHHHHPLLAELSITFTWQPIPQERAHTHTFTISQTCCYYVIHCAHTWRSCMLCQHRWYTCNKMQWDQLKMKNLCNLFTHLNGEVLERADFSLKHLSGGEDWGKGRPFICAHMWWITGTFGWLSCADNWKRQCMKSITTTIYITMNDNRTLHANNNNERRKKNIACIILIDK